MTVNVSHLCDLLRDVVCAVNELARSDDVHFSGRKGNKRVGFKVYKVESDLGDLTDGAVAHEV